MEGDNLSKLGEFIESFGIWGAVIALLKQVLQVVLAVIPGEPIEIVMGVLYGTVGGCLMCLVGIAIGSCVVFLSVRRLGKNAVEKVMSNEKYKKLKFLNDPSRRDVLLFILMFIPGTPKDTLTYFAPFTGIPFVRYIIISTVARIPSIISSSYIGSSIMGGNFVRSIIAFAVVGAVSLVGILVYNKIIEDKNRE
jgi:uncharacterized membrane protein YdjX (TVP38/TMEM64 family)